jgi:hypothetical protein
MNLDFIALYLTCVNAAWGQKFRRRRVRESFWFSPHQSTEIMKKTAAGGHLMAIFIAIGFPDFERSRVPWRLLKG